MTIEEREYASIELAAKALANELASTLKAAISSRGRVSLIVSGGRTPRHVFENLRRLDLDWPRVTVSLSDERWVSADHPDSNERLVRSYLLSGSASAANFVPLYGGENTPKDGQRACEARLRGIGPPFDAIYLGMGEDGHFASLFPSNSVLGIREGLCAPVSATQTRHPRLTLTISAILNSRRIFLLFAGAEKRAAYLNAKCAGPVEAAPLRLVLDQTCTPVTVMMAPR
jgi:6-phosphogluconolactonase